MEKMRNLIICSGHNECSYIGNIRSAESERHEKFGAGQVSFMCYSCDIGHESTALFT